MPGTVISSIFFFIPLIYRDIARIQVGKPLRAEIDNNVQNSFEKLGLEAGESALYVNGINMEIEQLDMFDLVDTLKQEEQLSTGFHNMGINVRFLPYPPYSNPISRGNICLF